jgi:hypothetical protein
MATTRNDVIDPPDSPIGQKPDPFVHGGLESPKIAYWIKEPSHRREIAHRIPDRVKSDFLEDAHCAGHVERREHAPYAFAVVEQVGARPGQGVSSMFRFGQGYGTILGIIGTLAIPVRHVSPAKWKRALGLNSDGETSRARAIETWPAQAELFARKCDHSRAEAALLGMYGLGRWRMRRHMKRC